MKHFEPRFGATVFIMTKSLKDVTKILRKIRAITFTENYGKLRGRGMSAWDERTLLPINLDNTILYPFATSGVPEEKTSSKVPLYIVSRNGERRKLKSFVVFVCLNYKLYGQYSTCQGKVSDFSR